MYFHYTILIKLGKESTITKEKGISICAELLFKGKKRNEIIQTITKDYKISAPCIDKWVRAARPIVQKMQQGAEDIRIREMDQALSQAVKEGLLSDIEIEAVLCRIVAGGMQVEQLMEDGVILRDVTPFEMITAAKAVYAKRGSNAPSKVATTDKAGNDIKPVNITLKLT